MTHTSILNDSSIGARGKQIAAEERRPMLEACDCQSDVDPATGRAVQRHQPGCRHYSDPYFGCGLRPACAVIVVDLGPSMLPIGVRRETLRDRLAELGLIAGPRK